MKFRVIILAVIITFKCYSQNLIPNPGFEEYTNCPSNHTTIYDPIKTKHWFSPSKGTPDLFSSCAISFVSTPRNFAGVAYPPDGGNYVGMYFGSPKQSSERTYREYLMCKLVKRLEKGIKYRFEFFSKPATNSRYIIDRLTYAFSPDSLSKEKDDVIKDVDFETILVDTLKVIDGWYWVSTTYVANGTEEYFIIGDFTMPGKAEFEEMLKVYSEVSQLKGGSSSYYLFDGFYLENLSKPKEFATEKPFSLDKIYFAFDSDKIPNEGMVELEKLANYMNSNRQLLLEIYGNTDTTGSVSYNEKLSLSRAISVKRALEDYNVAAERLNAYGNGEKNSLNPLDSLNRRTEFILIPIEYPVSD